MDGLTRTRNICLLSVLVAVLLGSAFAQVVDLSAGESSGAPTPIEVKKDGPYWIVMEIKVTNPGATTIKAWACGDSLCTLDYRFEQKHRGVWAKVGANRNVVLGSPLPSGTKEYRPGLTVTEHLRVHTGAYALYEKRPTRLVILAASDTKVGSRKFEIRTQEFRLPLHLQE